MPGFLAPIIAAVAAWLKKTVGVFLGGILAYVFERFVGRAYHAIIDYISTWWARRKRAEDQKKKQDDLEKDVESGAERNEETRKREEDYLNS